MAPPCHCSCTVAQDAREAVKKWEGFEASSTTCSARPFGATPPPSVPSRNNTSQVRPVLKANLMSSASTLKLEVGDTVTTARHTVTEADIVNFANVSGDHFYAHVDETSLDGTMFEGRVAHGYYILSKAAGLFVEPRKGPVLLNYGIDECRFTKPVYPGTTIGVKLTVVEKIAQERREPEDVAKGIVRYRVEVDDHEGDVVAIATILTMVKKLIKDPTPFKTCTKAWFNGRSWGC